MSPQGIKRLTLRLYRLAKPLVEAGKNDAILAEHAEKLRAVWCSLDGVARQRELTAAERKDKGRVCWDLFIPRDYAWEQTRFIRRTPFRVVDQSFSLEPALTRLPSYEDPWVDLEKVWGTYRKRYTLEKMQERVARTFAAFSETSAAKEAA